MSKTYAFRTTTQKLEDGIAARQVEESGDVITSSHFLGGRDWVLICRHGRPTVAELTADQFEALLARAVATALRQHDRPTARALGGVV